MPIAPFLFVLDVESIGLHGEPFSVGFVVLNSETGEEMEARSLSSPREKSHGSDEDRKWVNENVPEIPITHISIEAMMDRFWSRWMHWKNRGALMFAECAWPVEAKFLAMCIGRNSEERRWEGPYPLHEIASFMQMAGMNPMGVHPRLDSEMPKHDPLADSRQSSRLLMLSLKHEREKV